MEKKELIIYCDGGSRGNPGPAASAYVVMDGDSVLASGAEYIGISTNNMAEYGALLLAMQWINENKEEYRDYKISIIMDSQLVVRQVNGIYKIKNQNLKMKAAEVQKLKSLINMSIEITHVLRHKNTLADSLVNDKLDE